MFEYVTKKQYSAAKKDLEELIHCVQNEVREYFTFQYNFIGSVERNMVTMDMASNVGYDFDVNIRVNDDEEEYSAQEIRQILKKAFDQYNRYFSYGYTEDSTRVLTIKVKDRKNSRIVHSADFAVVNDCDDGRQQYIRFNKSQNSYTWEYQPKPYYQLAERTELIKGYPQLWKEVRDVYFYKKNHNPNKKKSRALFAETINEVYQRNFQ